MMRALLTLAGAVALSGCAIQERVTLLAPAQEGNEVGAVDILRGEDLTRVAALETQGTQARMRGGSNPRVQELDEEDPLHQQLINSLPLGTASDSFYFDEGEDLLPDAQMGRLQAFISTYIAAYDSRYEETDPEDRPGLHIEIAGFSSASGNRPTEEEIMERNLEISEERANMAYRQIFQRLNQANISVAPSGYEIFAAGDKQARADAQAGNEMAPESYRRVTVTVR